MPVDIDFFFLSRFVSWLTSFAIKKRNKFFFVVVWSIIPIDAANWYLDCLVCYSLSCVFGWRRGKKNQGLRIFVDFSFLFRIGGRGRITTFCWSEYETGARQPIARPFIYIYFQPFFFSPADYAGPWYYNRNTSSSTTTTSRNRRERSLCIFFCWTLRH